MGSCWPRNLILGSKAERTAAQNGLSAAQSAKGFRIGILLWAEIELINIVRDYCELYTKRVFAIPEYVVGGCLTSDAALYKSLMM